MVMPNSHLLLMQCRTYYSNISMLTSAKVKRAHLSRGPLLPNISRPSD